MFFKTEEADVIVEWTDSFTGEKKMVKSMLVDYLNKTSKRGLIPISPQASVQAAH